jgi:hypothetical protein
VLCADDSLFAIFCRHSERRPLTGAVGNWESQEPEMVAWVEQTFRYNVPHGKLNRGLAVVAGR